MKRILILGGLLLSKVVGAQTPASWAVDQSQYTNKFYVTCSAVMSCVDLDDENTVVAAFVGTECRGLVFTNTSGSTGQVGLLVVGSNSNNEIINFKVYDAAENVVINIIDSLQFATGDNIGTIARPFKMVDNHSPASIELDNLVIFNTGTVPAIVGELSTSDQDINQSHSYTLVADYDDNSKFSIADNVLSLTEQVSFSEGSILNIEIETDDNAGCTFTEQFEINIVKTQLASADFISPNGDGKNDFWMIQNVENYSDFSLNIFDQFGQVIYAVTSNYDNQWDGTYNGVTLGTGSYYYVFKDAQITFTGTITLLNN